MTCALNQCRAALRWLQSCVDDEIVSQEIADEIPAAVFSALSRPEFSSSLPLAWLRNDLHYLLATSANRVRGGVLEGNRVAVEGEGGVIVGGVIEGFHTAATAAAATVTAAAAADASRPAHAAASEAWVSLNPPAAAAPPSQMQDRWAATDNGRAAAERKLTDEQLAAVNVNIAFKTPQRIRLIAYAGTGKTTTLRHIARKHREKRVLYLVFNKARLLMKLYNTRGGTSQFIRTFLFLNNEGTLYIWCRLVPLHRGYAGRCGEERLCRGQPPPRP